MLIDGVAQHVRIARAVSRLIGWIYAFCWSASFYPQPLLNWQRKSTTGLSIDFPTLNVLGFICLSISNAAFLFSSTIRAQYAARNPLSPEPTVQGNDFAYALHAVVLSALTYSQFYPLIWGFKVGNFQRASRPVLGVFWGCVLGSLCVIIAIAAQPSGGDNPRKWAWIDAIYTVGCVKLVVTVVKYIPQAWLNYQRKSTVGWSIAQVLLDFIGGILSIMQLVLDSRLQGDWSGVMGNPVKFGLGNVSIFFDVIFMIQHYVLYRGHHAKKVKVDDDERAGSEEPLLGES